MAVSERIHQERWEAWRIQALEALPGIKVTYDHGTDIQDPETIFCFSFRTFPGPNAYERRIKKEAEWLLRYFNYHGHGKITLLRGTDAQQNGVMGWTGGWPGRIPYPEPNGPEANLELDQVLMHFLKEILGKDRIMDFLGERYVRTLGEEITTVHFHEMRVLINQIRCRERQRQSKIITN